ncbi:PREDICTED: E3 ubiquitin-protein ligase UPL5-like [Nelumbo nucifera]|uniref:HECT-type E3 ubiquitin transferase n=1 Tax=Nelumbo nucifera TaxID=4432 RepID=A0A1U8B2C6_NELNU|nr:PREDICTED: E3 ubiquitin-protein ligase UPL5-like [Nelumbo nucifera]
MSLGEALIDCVNQRHDRISSKRKFDDYGSSDEDFCDLVSVRMKRDEADVVNSSGVENETRLSPSGKADDESSGLGTRVSDARSASCSSSSSAEDMEGSVSRLHFFVRMISGGNTIVLHANSGDSVESVHEQIRRITGIPIIEQRLIYRGKQLQWEQTLAECSIQNDAGLQLVGRMRSTEYPRTWQVVDDLVSSICRLYRGDSLRSSKIVKCRVKEFLTMTPRDDFELASGHLRILRSSGAVTALVMLYLSPLRGNKECAEESIRLFLVPNIEILSKNVQSQCAPIVLEFCKLLTSTAHDDPLYASCRSTLAMLLENAGVTHWSRYFDHVEPSVVIREFYPFVNELAGRLSNDLESSMNSLPCEGISASGIREFSAFLVPLQVAIGRQMDGDRKGPLHRNLHGACHTSPCDGNEIELLHGNFLDLLGKIDQCLKKVEEFSVANGAGESESHRTAWSQYLAILKELNVIAKLYPGAEEKLCFVMRARRFSLNTIIRFAKRSDDHHWLLQHKDVTDFESRRHLVMMMFPDMKDDYEEIHEMLIDRSQLLAESFEYIARADAEALHGGLFMEFKNEEATGPGVLREWFCLVCQAIFNPQNALFLACPNDRRRFFPNPASNVDPMHLDYFGFCGRVIALALMHKVQVGIVFDRVFFLQLAGKSVTLEDVRDADPCLYMSCKKILEMDADFLDSDALGLTFVSEVEELGSRRVVELCPGGKGIVVNSTNREEYVKLLIKHRFVTSISEQVTKFSRGFSDILCNSSLQKVFFKSLELEDLDRMLHGSEKAICVEDWKAHTDYNGYKETERQIFWFWKIVDEMSPEQLRVLLFFWTSLKYLPVEGFGGLASRLYIFKTSDSPDRLPSSHTCFYRLCLPPYPSLAVMRDRLRIITQEHVSCSFGIW